MKHNTAETTEVKAAAMRAAEKWYYGPDAIPFDSNTQDHVEALVKVIDRETGLPSLLEALKTSLAYVERYYRTLPDDGPEQDHVMHSVIEPARAAIAKATGGEA
jgi:hypothetical protein